MSEPIRSFCSRVINLCYGVEDANMLTHLKSLKQIATQVRKEAESVQTSYGGRAAPTSKVVSKKKKK